MNIVNLNLINSSQKPFSQQKSNFQNADFQGKNFYGISFKGSEKTKDNFVFSEQNQILKKTCSLKEVKNLLLEIVELKHPPTKQHLVRTSIYAKAFAKKLKLPKEKVDEIEIAALFHDVGKLGLPDNYFKGEKNKKMYEEHPLLGSSLIQNIKAFKGTISDIVMYHHSHWNGSGFPNKLKCEEIPIETRIVSIADTFDTMTKPKYPGQKALTLEEAIETLKQNKQGKWAPGFAEDFIDLISQDNYALYKHVITSKY